MWLMKDLFVSSFRPRTILGSVNCGLLNSEPKLYVKNWLRTFSFVYCQLGSKYLLLLLISETVLIRETVFMCACGHILIRETVFMCACGHRDMRTGPHKVSAATISLFEPGWTDYAHQMPMSPPSFESHRRACKDTKIQ